MNYKILTIDDSRTIRMIVKRAFQQFNCEIIEAENGMEGLALAVKENPDLIVLDITMPVMTGIEMLSKLKADSDLSKIPVIMLTAESGKDNVMHIVKMGVNDYIVKPFKGDQLIERARHILDLKLSNNTNNTFNKADPKEYFAIDGDFLIIKLPQKVTRSIAAQMDSGFKEKIIHMDASWSRKMIIDLSLVTDINMNVIQMIISLLNSCLKENIKTKVVATNSQVQKLTSFQETSGIQTEPTIAQAKAAL